MTLTSPNCCERSSLRANGGMRVAGREAQVNRRPGSRWNRPSSFRCDDPLPGLTEPVDSVFDDVARPQVHRRFVAEADARRRAVLMTSPGSNVMNCET